MTTAEQSSQALKEFKKVMDELKIPFCLFLGTALGAYRDGTYCPGDEDDMDIAVDIKYFNRIDDIKREVNKQGKFTHLHDFIADDEVSPEVSFCKQYNTKDYSKIDIFFISDIEDKKCFRFYLDNNSNHYQTRLFDKKHFDSFETVNFFGEEYNLPGHIEEYLAYNYGDWKKPVNRKDWTWHKDNKCQLA